MTNAQPNLFTRSDTFFGVCEGLGQDLRIHPNLLRLGVAALLFSSPLAAAAAYAAAGALVFLTRFLFPNPVAAAEAPMVQESAKRTAPETQESDAPQLERLAA